MISRAVAAPVTVGVVIFIWRSPIWHLVSNKNNVYVVCPKGAGHFKHPIEAVRTLRADGRYGKYRPCTLILR